jgi:hypothetical protein
LARGFKEGGPYKLLEDPVKQRALLVVTIYAKLWHGRFGHLNYGSLPLLKDMLDSLTLRWTRKECARDVHSASMPRVAFPSSEHRSRGILDLIHSDVYGPMSLASFTGNLYDVTFIDDSSGKTLLDCSSGR